MVNPPEWGDLGNRPSSKNHVWHFRKSSEDLHPIFAASDPGFEVVHTRLMRLTAIDLTAHPPSNTCLQPREFS